MRQVIEADWGAPVDEILGSIDTEPAAAASIERDQFIAFPSLCIRRDHAVIATSAATRQFRS